MHAANGSVKTAVWTGALALLLTLTTGGVWTALLLANLALVPSVPWAAAAMALVLWAMWSYLGGKWGPVRTREARRRYLRATHLPRKTFLRATLAGGLSVISLAGLWIVMFRLVRIQGNAVPDFSKYPLVTTIAFLGMAALVSSVAEEAGFRGYFQGTLELNLSGRGAVLIAALLIAPAHGLTQGFKWPTVLFYLLVDIMLGTSAYLTKSILPGVAVHTFGLALFFGFIWPLDRGRETIWQGGTDPWFWIHVAQTAVFGALGIMAFVHLARLTGADRQGLKAVPATA
jgi:membrane protease YdiL (CAAX protease family)